MEDVSKKVLEAIKEKHIEPIPRWRFLLRAYLPWLLFAIFVVVGAIAVSVAIFIITDHDWDIYERLHKSFFEYLLLSLPYFWFVSVLILFGMAWYELRETRHGYRYGIIKIVFTNVLVSMILGVIFFYSGVGLRIEEIFANNLPFYGSMQPMRPPKLWDNPEKGLLIGEITTFTEGQGFNIRDFNGHDWLIKCLECIWRAGSQPRNNGMIVKIIGQEIGDGAFDAFEVRPVKDACTRPNNPNMVKRGCH